MFAEDPFLAARILEEGEIRGIKRGGLIATVERFAANIQEINGNSA